MSIYRDLMTTQYSEIARKFRVNPEHCDNPEHYETYITQDCFADHSQGMGVTHAFVSENDENGEKTIAGYITLRASSLTMDMDDYKSGYPALEISELAVACNFEGIGLGTDMVKTAIAEAMSLNDTTIGFRFVVLCADPAAVGFYSKLGFSKIPLYQEIPREHRNKNCVPMMLKIKF